MNPFLRQACQEDLQALLPWVGTPDLLRLWGGPSLIFPATPESIWAAMGGSPDNAYSLSNPSGELVGFGQILPRGRTVHLARIIVSPTQRGQGLGRTLCMKLIQAAIARHRPDEITLNVYADNSPAVALYRSLGFATRPADPSAEVTKIRMFLRPNLTINPGEAPGPGQASFIL
jgi:[ribosomal protein S18]-alanine N-acetyltransferase